MDSNALSHDFQYLSLLDIIGKGERRSPDRRKFDCPNLDSQ